MKIAVIDTGYVEKHPALVGKNIGYAGGFDRNQLSLRSHGTAICYEIIKECPNAEIVLYPIFNDSLECDPSEIIDVLKRILDSDDQIRVINLSLGIIDPVYAKEIGEICRQLLDKGIFVVSAFDNSGMMSYPACIDGVVGVDISEQVIGTSDEYVYIDGICVNIIGPKMQRRVAWDEPLFTIKIGTSFFAAHITGLVASFIGRHNECSNEDILMFLKEKANRKFDYRTKHEEISEIGRKIAVYPANKEIISLIKLKKYLKHELVGCYDDIYSGRIGKEILVEGESITVQSIDVIDYQNIDTLIVGHTDKLPISIKERIFSKILEQCEKNNTSIYALDTSIVEAPYAKKYEVRLSQPSNCKNEIDLSQNGKLWNVSVPIIAILGTGSQQGKFTTQVKLANFWEEKGYSTGIISTEPTGILFGAQKTFAYGYERTVVLPREYLSLAFNKQIYDLYISGSDIILLSLQGKILHYNQGNIAQLTSIQQEILFSASIDGYILCVSPLDTVEYINRTLSLTTSYTRAKPMGILVFPGVYGYDSHGKIQVEYIDENKLNEGIVVQYKRALGIPVFVMNSDNIENMGDIIINELSE